MLDLKVIADSGIVPRAGALINFDVNSAQILPGSYPLLDEFGKALKSGLSGRSFIVAGHTDSAGTAPHNQDLSVRRANSVADYLTAHHGIELSRLTLRGYGETKPIASNDTEKGRALNRRVEFILAE